MTFEVTKKWLDQRKIARQKHKVYFLRDNILKCQLYIFYMASTQKIILIQMTFLLLIYRHANYNL